LFLLAAAVVVIYLIVNLSSGLKVSSKKDPKNKLADILATSTPVPTPTPTPTPKPLTFAEMDELYGPCVHIPVLMYHHVQSKEEAIKGNEVSLTVYTDFFEKQMQYLKDHGYNVVSTARLVDFFDNGTKIPGKSVIITFDDGYEDFYTDAYPILQKFGFSATVFVPTGLLDNYNYLTWDQISSMKSSILFANHTWSHKNVMTVASDMQYEISTADLQLSEHSLNSPKIFAYPFGLDSVQSEKYLETLGYKAAFTTSSGSTLCKKQRLYLPRIRIGNSLLSAYGF